MALDLLIGVKAIAGYIYGEEDEPHQRRVRHLVRIRAIPTKKVGSRIESRRSWIDAAYAEPDPPRAAPEPPAPPTPTAPPGMMSRSTCEVCGQPIWTRNGIGRPRKWHQECRP